MKTYTLAEVQQIEFVSRRAGFKNAVETLVPALLQLARWDLSDGPCWCSNPPAEVNGWSHVARCRNARQSIAFTRLIDI